MNSKNLSPTRAQQRGAWLLLGLIFFGAVVGGVLVGLWVLKNIDLRLMLMNQPARVTIDEPVTVQAEAKDALQITLNDTIRTRVPVDQMIKIPIKDTLNVTANFKGEVPISMNVAVRDHIEINEVLNVDAIVDAEILGDKLKVPIRGKVPVKAKVPVSLDIPVDQLVQLAFTAPVGVSVKQDVEVPLRTEIEADIPINANLTVPVNAPFGAKVTFSPEPFAMTIVDADLRLPLKTLRLTGTREEDEAKPTAAAPSSAIPVQPATLPAESAAEPATQP